MVAALAYREAGLGDVAAVVALVESAYRGDASREGWTTEADLLDGQRIDVAGVRAIIDDPLARVLLAFDSDRLVACCELRRAGNDAYFGMFSVRPDGQGRGVGGRLLGEAERIARLHWNCRGMRMTVIDIRAELIAWYERRGYVRTGEYQPFPYGDERFGIPRRDDLRFEVLYKALR
ncbi:MAG: GNAT family N-acetyltransferase [Xanthomonadales bacterium]|nr:GNAT family N-acetyltransferase [Xanthomonadales bacterium]